MLCDAPFIGFVPVRDLAAATTFYTETLGLRTLEEIPGMATVLDAGGTIVRITAVTDHSPIPSTVAGWSVPDIEATARSLVEHGVELLRFDGLAADAAGIWTAPSGDRVCWFRDPSGNVLSLTEPVRRIPTRAREVAPVLPVRSVGAALDRLAKLGFTVSAFGPPNADEEAFYGFAQRNSVHLHVGRVDNVDPHTSTVSIYLYVDDANALHTEWSAAGVEGRFHPPHATDYGLLEGAYVDPDGNLIRYGSFV